MAKANQIMEDNDMMKNNMMKKAIATLAILGTISTLNFATVVFAADEIPVNPQPAGTSVIDYNELGLPLLDEMPLDGNCWIWEDVTWYDNFWDAWNHREFEIGDHAEYKVQWYPFYGWTTKGCTIIDVAVIEEDGKYAPDYKNDYNNSWYTRCHYE